MPGVINNPAIAMYVATAVALVVMIGFFIYLWRIDRHVRDLQQTLGTETGDTDHVNSRRTNPEAAAEPLKPQRIEKELSNGLDRR
jgi:hypothetical protein